MSIFLPLRVLGEGPKREAVFHYGLGPFSSRDIPVTMEPERRVDLRFRIPKELFRPGEPLVLEVFSPDHASARTVWWRARYQLGWRGEVPSLEPVVE